MEWTFVTFFVAILVSAWGIERNDKIIIIGAGTAGITAATKLYSQYGFKNIEILEAESHIGGYINTEARETVNGSEYIEHGDQWIIYGSLNNAELYDIARQMDTVLIKPSVSFLNHKQENWVPLIFSDGSELSEIQTNATNEFLLSIYTFITEQAYPPEHAPDATLRLSLYVAQFLENSAKYNVAYSSLVNIQDEINRFYENFIISYGPIGDWKTLSYRAFAKWLDNGSMLYHLKGGLSSLFNLTIRALPYKDQPQLSDFNIKFNKEVTKIDYSDAEVIIQTADGELHSAKKVIVTIPLGALKQSYTSLFSPPLPNTKILAIENFNVSYQEKTLLEFDEPWWPIDFCYYQLWRNEDYNKLAGGREWLGTLLGFSVVDSNSKMLVAYFKGPRAQLLKDVSDDTLKTELLQLLRGSLKNKFVVPEPVRFYRTNWSGNSHFGGGYSYKGAAANEARVSNADLAKPIDGKVYFAGEYTAKHNWGFLEAEITTGLSVVDLIVNSYNEN